MDCGPHGTSTAIWSPCRYRIVRAPCGPLPPSGVYGHTLASRWVDSGDTVALGRVTLGIVSSLAIHCSLQTHTKKKEKKHEHVRRTGLGVFRPPPIQPCRLKAYSGTMMSHCLSRGSRPLQGTRDPALPSNRKGKGSISNELNEL